MKKILALALAAVMFTTSIFAFGLDSLGVKGGINFGAGTQPEGYVKNAVENMDIKERKKKNSFKIKNKKIF